MGRSSTPDADLAIEAAKQASKAITASYTASPPGDGEPTNTLPIGAASLSALDRAADHAGRLLKETRRRFPFIGKIFADAGYQGPEVAAVVARTGTWRIEIVKRNELHKFVILPKRWIVECTFAWISRNRRLARDFERYAATVKAFFHVAMIRIMLKQLTRPTAYS